MKKKVFLLRCAKLLCLVLCVAMLSGMASTACAYYDYNVLKLAGFYAEPKNTLDVVFLGASDVFTGFSSAYAYDLYGFTSYPYALDASPSILHESQLREVLKHQEPKWIVVEINGFLYDDPQLQTDSGSLRRYLNNIPFSWNRVKTTLEVVPAEDWYIYFFPLAKRHSNWKNALDQGGNVMDLFAIRLTGSRLKGNVTSINTYEAPAMRDIAADHSIAPLEPMANAHLISFLEYCRENQLENVLFVRFPHIVSTEGSYERFQRCNEAERIVEEYGYDFVNMEREYEGIGLDFSKDFYNEDHLTVSGQKKLTEYFGRILTEEYGVTESDLTEKQRQSWEESAQLNRLFYEHCQERLENGEFGACYETRELVEMLKARK